MSELTFISQNEWPILPTHFTYPFLYNPHPFTKHVIETLKRQLPRFSQGQMFAVLVVKNTQQELAYLAGFSGSSLLNDIDNVAFVPRVINDDIEQALHDEYQAKVKGVNQQITELESSEELALLTQQCAAYQAQASKEVNAKQTEIVNARKKRKQQRLEAEQEGDFDYIHELNQQSIEQKKALKKLKLTWQEKIDDLELKKDFILNKINSLKLILNNLNEDLKSKVNAEFRILNSNRDVKNLNQFSIDELVIDAADEAIIKLLQFAFKSHLTPVSFGQFWWGPSPESEVRHHGRIYPVSQTKCKTILQHMLAGITVDTDPLLTRLSYKTQLNIIYQDDHFVVINKPVDLLSVPGVNIENSVYTQVKMLFPYAEGPLIVHRLDMATSGLMVVALNKSVHKHLQQQFIQRTVDKRYVALLEGNLQQEQGSIVLPLRPDLVDRPRQVVCAEYGRYAETKWQVIERKGDVTRVWFYPKTGRSHQLRMHAAHQQGLNMPIVGDDLYGFSAERLHLHADLLGFVHPYTNEKKVFQVDADF